MFDIEPILVYGWTWKYYERDTDEMMKNVLKNGVDEDEELKDEELDDENIEEMFQVYLYKKYNLTYGKAIPRRGGEDDAVCYISFPCQNKDELIQSFSTSTEDFASILKIFELVSPPEIYTLVSVDF